MHTPAMATPMAVHTRARGCRKGLTVMAVAKSLTQPGAVPSASSAQEPNRPRVSHTAPMTSDKKPYSHTFHQHRFSTDHSREHVPMVAWGPGVKAGANLGTRDTYAHIAATVADYLGAEPPAAGKSFLPEILK